MFKILTFTSPKKKTKKKSPSPKSKRVSNIEKKFKNYLARGYSINQARYWSKL